MKKPASRSFSDICHRSIGVADDEGDDLRGTLTPALSRWSERDVPALLAKPQAEVGGALEELFAAVGFVADDFEGGEGGGAGGGGLGCGKEVGARALASQSINDWRPQTKPPLVPSALLSVPTRMWAPSLRWRVAAKHAFGDAAAVFAEDAGGVGLVDQQHCIVLVGQLRQARKRCQVAVHAEERVGDDQPAAEFGGAAEHVFQRIAVGVRDR